MALSPIVGWSAKTEWVESALYLDPSFLWCEEVSRANGDAAEHRKTCVDCLREARYWEDGRVEHLRVKVDAEPPTRIRFRPLTARERSIVRDEVRALGPTQDEGEGEDQAAFAERVARHSAMAFTSTCYLAAAIALDFPDWEAIKRIEWRGLRVLPEPFLTAFARRYGEPSLTHFGRWIWHVSNATDDQKKTSSPGATTTKPTSLTVASANGSPNGGEPSPVQTSD